MGEAHDSIVPQHPFLLTYPCSATMNSIPFTAHVSSLWRAITSDPTAIKDQKAFVNALKGQPDQPISETVDRIPIAEPVKGTTQKRYVFFSVVTAQVTYGPLGLIHLALNDKGNGYPQNAPTRTFAVLGDLGDRDGWSAAAPFVAGVAEGATHPFTSGTYEPVQRKKRHGSY